MSATSLRSSRQRFHESQASPEGSATMVSALCSKAHQSLFQLPPSIWWDAVAVPQRKPAGKVSSCVAVVVSDMASM